MAYTNYNHSTLTINGEPILASNVSFRLSSRVYAKYLEEKRSSFFPTREMGSESNFIAGDGVSSSLSFTYFLTGKDFLKRYIADEENGISGNFGGLYFGSGYLTSYELSADPFSPAMVNADIAFFGALSGGFTGGRDVEERPEPITLRNMDFCLSGINGTETIKNDDPSVSRLRYSFSSQINPSYSTDSPLPAEIRFNEKETYLSVETYDIGGELPHGGLSASGSITLRDKNDNIIDSYGVEGIIDNKTIGTSVGDKVTHSCQIRKSFVDEKPTITSFAPIEATAGDAVTINGNNLKTTTEVIFKDRESKSFTALSNTEVKAVVPDDAITGPIIITNYAGSVESSSNIKIT